MFSNKRRYVIIALTVLLALFGAGCSKPEPSGAEAKPPAGEEIKDVADAEEGPGDASADALALPIGLYIKTGSEKRVLQSQVQSDYTIGKDIIVLSAFFSEEQAISGGSFGKVWRSYKDKLPEALFYKIGYRLSYTLAAGSKVDQMIAGPADTEVNRNYIETYIYDDVNQDGWYSHLLVSDMCEDTVVTSIKLTAGPDIDQVGDIEVEAFLYKIGAIEKKAGTYSVVVVKK